MTLEDILSSHFGFKIDLEYLSIRNLDVHTEDGLNKLIIAVSDRLEVIKKDPYLIYQYAKNIIKGRWPEAEETIKNDPFYSSLYAKNIVKGRWPEKDKFYLRMCQIFIGNEEDILP